MPILAAVILFIFLFMMSAFWSGAETAFTSLSKYRVKKLIVLNKSLAIPLGQWLKFPYYILTTVLIGNNINNFILSYLATILTLKILASILFFIPREVLEFATWLNVTFFLLLFGEVTPKIYSRRNPEKVTLALLPIVSRLMKISIFIIWPFTKIINLFFPKLSLVPVGRLSYVSLEEIRGLITEVDNAGTLGKDTGKMLEGVLSLGKMNISQIMTPINEIEAVNLDQDEEKFIDLIVETGRSRVPVYHSSIDKMAGFIHTKDLLWCWKSRNGHFSREIIRPPYYINQDKKLSDLLKEFQTGKTHLAFVRDAVGNLAGVVTLEDMLENIVGEILDEYDLKENEGK